MKPFRYFVDNNGVIFTILDNGQTNFPGEIKVEEAKGDHESATVMVLGAYEGEEGNSPRLVEDEYQVWDSLIDLAVAIEEHQ